MTMRPLEPDGTWGAKCRKEYALGKNGQRMRLPSGEYKSRRVNNTDWNDRDKAENWRTSWADYANRALEQKGISERIDNRSYERQGAERIPTVHMGVAATQMERRGIATEKGNVNREIVVQNKLLKEIKARLTRLYSWSKAQATVPQGKESVMAQLWQARQEMNRPTTRYGKVKALKESAALFSFLQSNDISSMEELHSKIKTMQTDYYALRGGIRDTECEIAKLTERLDYWRKHEKYKGVHKQLANVKPRKQDEFIREHHAELALFDAAARYLGELKKSGEAISPKKWRSETATLTARKNELYERMKAMRTDIKAVEQLKKAADSLVRTEESKDKEHKR